VASNRRISGCAAPRPVDRYSDQAWDEIARCYREIKERRPFQELYGGKPFSSERIERIYEGCGLWFDGLERAVSR
jgi:hypothetical protein